MNNLSTDRSYLQPLLSTVLPLVLLALALSPAVVWGQDSAIVLHDQRELFVDDYLLDRVVNADVRLATPVPRGAVLEFTEPWEGQFCAYASVVHDGTFFRMYYRGLAGYENQGDRQVTCYAVSADGIHWRKPDLGLFEVSGSWDNNVVMNDTPQGNTHNFCVMYDDREAAPPTERFKAIGGHSSSGGLYRYVSEDGIHWNRYRDTTGLFANFALDSHNVLTWVPAEQQYAIYLRDWSESDPANRYRGVRTIARSVSKDFIHWSEPERMTFGDTEMEHLYTNATHPYFRAPQILIAMPFRFSPEQQVLSEEELIRLGVDPTQRQGVSDAVLMTSRGGNAYDRKFLTSFVRPGTDPRNWAARSNMPALGVVPTGESEMSFFVIRAYGTEDVYLERMTLRKDGFASVHADEEEGYALTKPVRLQGSTLSANYSTSAQGYIKVVLLDEAGNEIAGFGEADAMEAVGDRLDGAITWKSGQTIRNLRGRSVRIKFIARDADIYAFRVSGE